MDLLYKPHTRLPIAIGNSLLEISLLIKENFKILAKYVSIFVLFTAGLSSIGYYKLAYRSIKWILLGAASSIGFGFGMHTFVLFLAPHIAAVTMAAHSCKSLDFPEPPYPEEILCPDNSIGQSNEVFYMDILYKVWLESFMWGLGTALGELPPYLAARLRARALGHQPGSDASSTQCDPAGWESWMIKIVNKIGFFGILLCAAIPNPLFDAAGVASGMAQVPFMTFFGATLLGKAVIKVTLQASFVILAFHEKNMEMFILHLDNRLGDYFPATKKLNLYESLTGFLEDQRNNVLTKKIGDDKGYPLIQTLFNWVIFVCFALFFISLINALDGQYRARIARKRVKKD